MLCRDRPVRTEKLHLFIREAQARGTDLETLVKWIGATEDRSTLDEISACRAFDIFAEAVPEGFGVEQGLRWNIESVGVMGYALLRSTSTGTLMDRVARCVDLCGNPFRASSTLDASEWSINILPDMAMSERATMLCVEEALTSAMPHWLGLTGSTLPVLRAEVSMRGCSDAFREAFRGNVETGRPNNRLVLRRSAFHQPLQPRAEECERIVALCEALVPVSPDGAQGAWVRSIIRLILSSRETIPSLTQAARELQMSKRTFNRRLEQAQTSYRDLVSLCRFAVASGLVRCATLSIKEIAHVVGYQDVNSLMRGFRRHFGQSLGSWRRAGDTVH